MWTAFASTAATSTLFLTAMAPNILAVSLVKQTAGIEIDWTAWFLGALPVAGPLLLLMPLLVYVLYPPGIKQSPEAPRWAAEQLLAMGPMSRKQKTMAGSRDPGRFRCGSSEAPSSTPPPWSCL